MKENLDVGDLETLNGTQQTLKVLMLSLAAASRADLNVLAGTMQMLSTKWAIDPLAKRMIEDLAAGAHAFSSTGFSKQ